MNLTNFEFSHSLKNIPIPHKDSYLKQLINKTEDFIQRLRWKAFFYLRKDEAPKTQKNTYGFRTAKNAPQIPELTPFENDLSNMISNLEFKNNTNKFQKDLSKEIKKVKKSKNVFIKADKTHNIYEINKSDYNKLLKENITSEYKKVQNDCIQSINKEAKIITDKLEISDRVEELATKDAYLTVKDHKPEFPADIKCRLINPTKSNIGQISKQILDDINIKIKDKLNLRLLKNTNETIDWFKNIDKKTRKTFLQLDIVSYYPSITEKLLDKALLFAQETLDESIPIDHIQIIKNARKSILCSNSETWQKKDSDFDVTMGAFDGAQLTDLVGLYLLNILSNEIPEIEFGFYRDDGLGIHRRIPANQLDKIKKKIFKIFKDSDLKITMETSLNKVDFLDVTFNLANETYEPFRKPNDTPLYINKGSNHPPHVLKNLTKAINQRLSSISCNENVFDKHKYIYEKALKESGHKSKLKFEPETTNKRKKKTRDRNVIRYAPPYNIALKTNIGKTFLSLIDKHFPKNHPLHPIANRRTIKLSYSCTPNVGALMAGQNRKILTSNESRKNKKDCNCQIKEECPVNNKCCTPCVIYKATETTSNAYYIGMTSLPFKSRFNQHKHSFRTEARRNNTALSQFTWNKNCGPTPNLKWEIIKECKKFSPGDRMCDLCTSEKLYILKCANDVNNINLRNDVSTRCCHVRNTRLSAIT